MKLSSRWIRPFLLASVVVAGLAVPARAEGLSFRGWGPRVGVSINPDQVFAGVHFNLGEIAHNLRFQPNLEIGYGDDELLIGGYFPALWMFKSVEGDWTPYAGGEIGFTYQDFDDGGSDTDVALNAVGGGELMMKNNNRFFLEAKVGLIENPDVKVLAGWTF